MSLRQPHTPPPTWSPPVRDTETIVLAINLITPMFGGGYEAGKVDIACPIHPAGIRGHLRFWWRATIGATYASLESLTIAEEALWGSGDTYGAVALQVEMQNNGRLQRCGRYEPQQDGRFRSLPTFEQDWPAYAMQPFQGKTFPDRRGIETEPSLSLLNASFQLRLNVPATYRNEILLALKTWILYGGLGARTRRGCGSIATDFAFPALDLPVSNAPELLTVLQGAHCLNVNPVNNPIIAWQRAVQLYQQFRQGVGFARNEGQERNRPGRSRWPEPDTIRTITRQRDNRHAPMNLPYGFPRADLGLPIIFHFQGDGDPADTTLQGGAIKQTRFASPVITKALRLPNGMSQPTLLILNSPHVWDMGNLDLNGTPITRAQVEMTVVDRARIHPLTARGLPVREALVEYANAQGWTQGTLL